METIHSRSYTYMIKNLYSDPAEIFDTVIDDKRIMERADSITKCYDDFMNYARKYEVTGKGSSKELKRKLCVR